MEFIHSVVTAIFFDYPEDNSALSYREVSQSFYFISNKNHCVELRISRGVDVDAENPEDPKTALPEGYSFLLWDGTPPRMDNDNLWSWITAHAVSDNKYLGVASISPDDFMNSSFAKKHPNLCGIWLMKALDILAKE